MLCRLVGSLAGFLARRARERLSELRVAVVGAGIAGLATAIALGQAGIQCVVLEQASVLTEVGVGLQIAPNGARLLHRLGLREYLRQVAVSVEAIDMLRWDSGQPMVHVRLGAECEAVFGTPFYTVHRAQLQQGMLGLLPGGAGGPSGPGGLVRLGMRCQSITEHPDGIDLEFAHGEMVSADVVIGADGINSTVRRHLFADRPRFSGYAIYRGLVPADRGSALPGPGRIRIWLGSSQHFIAYPVSAGGAISFGATVPAASWAGEFWVGAVPVADVADAYAGWHEGVRSLISSAESITKWALHDRDLLSGWGRDRITLVGDAAHPMLPFGAQGANQAIEDAVVLAACLRRADTGSVAQALRAYERLRGPRVAVVHELSRATARSLRPADQDGQPGPDQDPADYLSSRQWLYGYDPELEVERLSWLLTA
jgi:salicylate hydroxylase